MMKGSNLSAKVFNIPDQTTNFKSLNTDEALKQSLSNEQNFLSLGGQKLKLSPRKQQGGSP
jgi:hypothetical protein